MAGLPNIVCGSLMIIAVIIIVIVYIKKKGWGVGAFGLALFGFFLLIVPGFLICASGFSTNGIATRREQVAQENRANYEIAVNEGYTFYRNHTEIDPEDVSPEIYTIILKDDHTAELQFQSSSIAESVRAEERAESERAASESLEEVGQTEESGE